jgi:flavodoxin
MNTLIVYDSQFGNTERIAQAMASALHAYGPVRAVRASRARAAEAKDLDLLLVGCPTQGWQPTEPTVAYVAGIAPDQLRSTAVTCFDTRFHMPPWLTGSAARILANRLERRGVSLVVPPESFFVASKEGPLETGELERAATWARMIVRQIAPPRLVTS